MEIVVNDTNIFIDLHSIRLLDQFFELPITVHTVDFVINELTDEVQFKAINKYIENGKLKVQSFEADELLEIIELQSKTGGNVSIPDCAVWNYAKKHNYTLLTGDGEDFALRVPPFHFCGTVRLTLTVPLISELWYRYRASEMNAVKRCSVTDAP